MQWSGLGEDDGKSTFKQCLRFPPLQSSHRRRRRARHQEHGPEGKWFFEPPCSSPDDRPPGQGTKVLWAFHPLKTQPSWILTTTRRKSGGFISNSTMNSLWRSRKERHTPTKLPGISVFCFVDCTDIEGQVGSRTSIWGTHEFLSRLHHFLGS